MIKNIALYSSSWLLIMFTLTTGVLNHVSVHLPACVYVAREWNYINPSGERGWCQRHTGGQRTETGHGASLGPCVYTLGAQPMISLPREANMAFPACTQKLVTGHGIRCGHMAVVFSVYHAQDFPIDFHSSTCINLLFSESKLPHAIVFHQLMRGKASNWLDSW